MIPSQKRLAIVQSSYIPWKGYFDLIRAVDEFVLFDDVQYTKRDWRNRNQIKTKNGLLWLSIPVNVSGRYLQKIRDVTVEDRGWACRHWRNITSSYARAPHFARYRDDLASAYDRAALETHLSCVNRIFLEVICTMLDIQTRITSSMDYEVTEGKTARLISLCQQASATEYLSGPSARAYIEPEAFARAGITLTFADYGGYPEYEQLYPPFVHSVSVLDLLFSVGPESRRYMKELYG